MLCQLHVDMYSVFNFETIPNFHLGNSKLFKFGFASFVGRTLLCLEEFRIVGESEAFMILQSEYLKHALL